MSWLYLYQWWYRNFQITLHRHKIYRSSYFSQLITKLSFTLHFSNISLSLSLSLTWCVPMRNVNKNYVAKVVVPLFTEMTSVAVKEWKLRCKKFVLKSSGHFLFTFYFYFILFPALLCLCRLWQKVGKAPAAISFAILLQFFQFCVFYFTLKANSWLKLSVLAHFLTVLSRGAMLEIGK